MTHNEEYDLTVIPEPALYRALVTSHPSQDTGMLVLTDSSLYFLRNHNGKTFVGKIVWRREILSCIATSHAGYSEMKLNTSRGQLHFTGETSPLELIASQLTSQPKPNSSNPTWSRARSERVNAPQHVASKTASPRQQSSSSIPWMKVWIISLAAFSGLVIIVSAWTGKDPNNDSELIRHDTVILSTVTPAPVRPTSTPKPTSTLLPTATPKPKIEISSCHSPIGQEYGANILSEMEVIGNAAREMSSKLYELIDNPLLARNSEWISHIGLALAALRISAQDILQIEAPEFAVRIDSGMKSAAIYILEYIELIPSILTNFEDDDIQTALSLVENWNASFKRGAEIATEICG